MRSVPPSALSLLGLVRHMAEVENNWFRFVLGRRGRATALLRRRESDGDFDESTRADVDEAFAYWRDECEHAREVLSDVRVARRRRTPADRRERGVSVRWMLVHMIEEYARHNGHADLIRERIDGTTGD